MSPKDLDALAMAIADRLNAKPKPALCDTDEAAAYISRSAETLVEWRTRRNASGPPFCKYQGRVRYRYVDLDKWIAANMVGEVAA